MDLLGLEGLEAEALDEGLVDLLADLAGVREAVVFLALLAGFLFAALAGFTGVLNSGFSGLAVKLSSLIGDTEDLLADVDLRVLADRRADDLLADAFLAEAGLFLIEFGVVFAFDEAFGRGVLLIGFEAVLLAGVCLVIICSRLDLL